MVVKKKVSSKDYTPVKVKCPYCNQVQNGGWKTCINCGRKIPLRLNR